MKSRLFFIVVALLGVQAAAQEANLARKTWSVDGVEREALIAAPASAQQTPAPLVFVWHGHGGTMRNANRSFHIETLWPDAIVVYPQGLNTPGRLTDPEGKRPGWQPNAGEQGDRDLRFFDAMLASLKSDYKVDDRRIYSTGHSNGGGFTYLLWAARGDVFAAMGPSSSAAAGRQMKDLKPKPVLHVAGEADPLVKYEWQKATMDALRKLNGCEETGSDWGKWARSTNRKAARPS